MRLRQTSIQKDVYTPGEWVSYTATLNNNRPDPVTYSRVTVYDKHGSALAVIPIDEEIPAYGSVTRDFAVQVKEPEDGLLFVFDVEAYAEMLGRQAKTTGDTRVVLMVDPDKNIYSDANISLTVEQMSPVKEAYQKEDTIDFKVTVTNQGKEPLRSPRMWFNSGMDRVNSNDVDNIQTSYVTLEKGESASFDCSVTITNSKDQAGWYRVEFIGGGYRAFADGSEKYEQLPANAFKFPVVPGTSSDVKPACVTMKVEQVTEEKEKYVDGDVIGFLVTLKNEGCNPVENVHTRVTQVNVEDRYHDFHYFDTMQPGDVATHIFYVNVKHYGDAVKYFTVEFDTDYDFGYTGSPDMDALVDSFRENIGKLHIKEYVYRYLIPDGKSTEVNTDYDLQLSVFYSGEVKDKFAQGDVLHFNAVLHNAGRKDIAEASIYAYQVDNYNELKGLKDLGPLPAGGYEYCTFDIPITTHKNSPKKLTLDFYGKGVYADDGFTYATLPITQRAAVDPKLVSTDDFSSGSAALKPTPEFTVDIVQTGTVKELYDEGDVLSFLCTVNARNCSDFDETKAVVIKSGSRNAQKKETTPGTFVYNYTVTEEDVKDGYFTIVWDFYGYQSGKKVYDKNLRALSFCCNKKTDAEQTEEETDNNGVPGVPAEDDETVIGGKTENRSNQNGNGSRPNLGSFRRPNTETQNGSELPDESKVIDTEDVFLTGSYGGSDDMWATDAYDWNFSIVNEGGTAYTGGYLVVINTAAGDASTENQLPACAANSVLDGLSTTVVPTLDEQLSELVLREAYAVLTAEDGSSVRTNSIFFTVSREPLEGLMHLSVSADLGKEEYHANDVISAVIAVTNTSLTPIYDIDLEVTGAGKNDRNTFSQDLESFLSGCDCLEPGDSFSFSYEFMLTENDEEAGSFYRGFRATGYNENHLQFAMSDPVSFEVALNSADRKKAELALTYTGAETLKAEAGDEFGMTLLLNNTGECDLTGFTFIDLDSGSYLQSTIDDRFALAAGGITSVNAYTTVTEADIENGCLVRDIRVVAQDAEQFSWLAAADEVSFMAELIMPEEIPETLTVSNVRLSDDGRIYFTATNSSDITINEMNVRCGKDGAAPWGTAGFAPGASADGYMEIKFTEEELASGIFSRDLYLAGYKHASDDIPAAVSPAVHVEGKIDTEALKESGYYADIEIFAYGVNLTRGFWREGDKVLVELTITNHSSENEVAPAKYILNHDGAAVAKGYGNFLLPGASCVSYCYDVLTAEDIERQYYEHEIVLTYEVLDEYNNVAAIATAHGRIFMNAPDTGSRKVTLSGSASVDVGSALDGAFGYEWSPTVINETGEKFSFDFRFCHNGEEKIDAVPWELEAGESMDCCYGFTPVLTDEERATIRTEADTATTYYTLQVIAHGESGETYYSNIITFTYTVHLMPYQYSIYTDVRKVNEDGSFVIELGNETPQSTGIDMKIGFLYMNSPSVEDYFETVDLFGDRVFEPDEYEEVTVKPHFTDEEYELGYFEREIEVWGNGYNEETGEYDIWTSGYATVKGTLSGNPAGENGPDAGWDKDYPLAGTLSITAVPVNYGQLYVTATNTSGVRADQVTVVCGNDKGDFIGDTHLYAGDTESERFILNFTEEELLSNHCTRDLYMYAYDTYYSDTVPAFSSNVVHLDFDINDDFSDSGLLRLTAGGQNMYGETVLTLTNMCERDIKDLTLFGTTNNENTVEKDSFDAYVNEFNSLYTGFGKNCDITFTYKPTFTSEELANGAYIRNLYVLGYVSPIFWTASNTVTLTGTCGDRKNDAALALYVNESSGTEKEEGEDLICTREVTIANMGLYPIENIRVIADNGSIFIAEAERLEPGETTVVKVTFVVEGCKPGYYSHKLIVTANAIDAPAGTVPMATTQLNIYTGA